MTRRILRGVGLAVLFAGGACAGSSPSSSGATTPVSGTWSGTLTEVDNNVAGRSTAMTLVLTESMSSLVGQARVGSDVAEFRGTRAGSMVTLQRTDRGSLVSFALIVSLPGDELVGTFRRSSDSPTFLYQVSLRRTSP